MTDDVIQQYMDARVENAKTLADYHRNYAENPEIFVAGVQYALDRMLGMSERYYNIPYPSPSIGDVVPVRMLHIIGIEILEKAKRGEPQ